MFKPENIAVQIGQNFFQFVVTTIAWCIAGALYDGTNNNGYNNNFNKFNSARDVFNKGTSDAYSVNSVVTTAPSYSSPSSSYGSPKGTVIGLNSNGKKFA